MPSLEKLIESAALESGTAFTFADDGRSVPSPAVSLSIRL